MVGMHLRNMSLADLHRNADLIDGVTVGRALGHNVTQGTGVETVRESVTELRQVYPTAALALRIQAGGDAGDDIAGSGARSVLFTGIADDWTIQSEAVDTAGASASDLTTILFRRILAARVLTSGTDRGTNAVKIDLENSANVQLGRIAAATSFMSSATTTVPIDHTLFVTGFSANTGSEAVSTVISLEATTNSNPLGSAPFSSVTRVLPLVTLGPLMNIHEPLHTYLRFEALTDIELTGQRIGGTESVVTAGFEYMLVRNSIMFG